MRVENPFRIPSEPGWGQGDFLIPERVPDLMMYPLGKSLLFPPNDGTGNA